MLKPLDDRVVVRPVAADKQTEGGIVIPDVASKKPTTGEVLAVGEGRILEDGTRAPVDVSIGDRVLFTAYSGSLVEFEGEELLILNESDLIATVN